MRSHGPGFRFHPSDVELIMYYLTRKVMRRKFRRDGIRVLDLYSFSPWDLQGQARWKRDLKYYFFCERERKYSTGERTNRATAHGFWKTTGEDCEVCYDGETVGMRKSLIFHTKNPTRRTNWVMHEYKLQDEYIKKLGLKEAVFVICVIFEKGGLGPRNGDQYAGPYRDEDWDNDNDCDTDDDELDNRGEDTNVVGALTQVHTDKGESTVPNDFDRADGYYVGSSSRTLPSDVGQTVNRHLPLSDEFGMFVDEFPSALLENEPAQDIGVDGDVNCEPSIPANEENLYDGLEDFCRLDDFADYDSCVHGFDFLSNQNIQPDDYLELADCMDVSGPFEGSHDHDLSGPGQPSPSFTPMIPECNLALQEPAETERPINDPQTGLSRFRSSNFPDSGSSELHIPYRHYQTADGSIGFHGQEASMNGQVDHHFDGVGTAARFGIVQPPQSMPRGSPHIPRD